MGGQYNIALSATDTLFRSDDGGQNWRPVCPIIGPHVFAVYGDLQHIYLQTQSGVIISTDTGNSLQNLCGPRNWEFGNNRATFYAKGPYIYASQNRSDNPMDPYSRIYYLNLDSIGTFQSHTVSQQINGSTSDTLHFGDTVSASFAASADSGVGIDTAHFTIHFDSTTLSIQNYLLPYGWSVLSSSSHNGILDLLLADTADSLVPPAVTISFNSYLSANTTSTVSLDSVHLTGKWMGCDIATQSVSAPDSVTLHFLPQCGDSIILAAMQGRLPFTIQSIIPNPAQNEITITGGRGTFTISDPLGRSYSVPQNGSVLDISSLPSGVYFISAGVGGAKFVKE
jgi:hypothetical protein